MSDDNSSNNNQQPLSLNKLGRIVRKLHLTDNSILLIRAGSALAQEQNLESLANTIRKSNYRGVIAIVVEKLDDLEVMSEKRMNDLGWYRVSKVFSRMIHKSGDEKLEESDQEESNQDDNQPSEEPEKPDESSE